MDVCKQLQGRTEGGPPIRVGAKKAQGVRQSMLRLLACIQENDRKKGREMLQFFTYNLKPGRLTSAYGRSAIKSPPGEGLLGSTNVLR